MFLNNCFYTLSFYFIVLSSGLILKAQSTNIFIQPVEQNINVDSSTIIKVSISDVEDLHSYSITLAYDSNLLEIIGVDELDFFTGYSTLFLHNINVVQNILKVDASILGTASQDGSGDLFAVKFQALSTGIVNLNFQDIILRDSQNHDIAFQSFNGLVNITPLTKLENIESNVMNENNLSNYPNPFNNSTVISYYSIYGRKIDLKIFTILGKEIYSKIDESMVLGEHKYFWNGRNNSGMDVASGIYLITIREKDKLLTRKINFLK